MLAVATFIDRSQQNPDQFIGDIVPGYQSFMPYLLETKNQESGISKNFALSLSRFQTQQRNADERGFAWNFHRRSGPLISFARKPQPAKLKAPGF
jgi:hypothetical protein